MEGALMNILLDLLNKRIADIEDNIREFKDNSQLKGSILELSIFSLLKEFLPNYASISRGWIFCSNGERSEERDIIVFDRNKVPSFMLNESVGLIPKLAALYDIQIKSNVRKKELKNIYDKFSGNWSASHRALISYKSTLDVEELFDELCTIDSRFLDDPKINIFVLGNKGYFFHHVDKIKLRDIFYNGFKKDSSNINSENLAILNDILDSEITRCRWHIFDKSNLFQHSFREFIVGMINTLFGSEAGKYFINNDESYVSKILSLRMLYKGKEVFQDVNLKDGITRNLKCEAEIDENSKSINLKCFYDE